MEIAVKASVQCVDGSGGRVERLIVDPNARQLTHIVVREPGLRGTEWMVPIEDIASSTREVVNLKLTQKQLILTQPFVERDFRLLADTEIPDTKWLTNNYDAEATEAVFAPYAPIAIEPDKTVHSTVPQGELSLKLGNRVEATDGSVGKVDELVFDAQTGDITHLVMQEGHLWDKRHVTIPISQVDRIDGDKVYLKLSKAEIEALPAM